MNSKTLVAIIYAAIFSTIVGLISQLLESDRFEIFLTVGVSVFFLAGIYLISKYSEFIKTREYKLSGLGISLVIIGAMFKIMHWPMSVTFIILGYGWVLLNYLVYMVRHRKFGYYLSILKLLFLLTFIAGKFLAVNHLANSYEADILSVLLLFLIVIGLIKEKKLGVSK